MKQLISYIILINALVLWAVPNETKAQTCDVTHMLTHRKSKVSVRCGVTRTQEMRKRARHDCSETRSFPPPIVHAAGPRRTAYGSSKTQDESQVPSTTSSSRRALLLPTVLSPACGTVTGSAPAATFTRTHA